MRGWIEHLANKCQLQWKRVETLQKCTEMIPEQFANDFWMLTGTHCSISLHKSLKIAYILLMNWLTIRIWTQFWVKDENVLDVTRSSDGIFRHDKIYSCSKYSDSDASWIVKEIHSWSFALHRSKKKYFFFRYSIQLGTPTLTTKVDDDNYKDRLI